LLKNCPKVNFWTCKSSEEWRWKFNYFEIRLFSPKLALFNNNWCLEFQLFTILFFTKKIEKNTYFSKPWKFWPSKTFWGSFGKIYDHKVKIDEDPNFYWKMKFLGKKSKNYSKIGIYQFWAEKSFYSVRLTLSLLKNTF
jgi:hypothetical protein